MLTEAAKKNVIVTGFVFCCCFSECEYHQFLSQTPKQPSDDNEFLSIQIWAKFELARYKWKAVSVTYHLGYPFLLTHTYS